MPAGETDSAQEPADDPPRPLLGAGFWAFLVFGIVCVLAGVGVVILGPTLWAAK